jgi:D-glycero-D-manno-heptose 1,7-bisphosphate phosphatase
LYRGVISEKNIISDKNGFITFRYTESKTGKTKYGLFFQARDKYEIDLSNSVMIGDSAKDIIAAKNAGVKFKILVLTGNGQKAKKELEEKQIFPDYIAKNLFDAHNWIIKNTGF